MQFTNERRMVAALVLALGLGLSSRAQAEAQNPNFSVRARSCDGKLELHNSRTVTRAGDNASGSWDIVAEEDGYLLKYNLTGPSSQIIAGSLPVRFAIASGNRLLLKILETCQPTQTPELIWEMPSVFGTLAWKNPAPLEPGIEVYGRDSHGQIMKSRFFIPCGFNLDETWTIAEVLFRDRTIGPILLDRNDSRLKVMRNPYSALSPGKLLVSLSFTIKETDPSLGNSPAYLSWTANILNSESHAHQLALAFTAFDSSTGKKKVFPTFRFSIPGKVTRIDQVHGTSTEPCYLLESEPLASAPDLELVVGNNPSYCEKFAKKH